MRVGIFGGTFNPVHNGHLKAAREFIRQAALDRLYVIPDRVPPHKEITEGDDPELRLEMTRIAFGSVPEFAGRAVVSDIEIRNPGKSYTYRTLCHFVQMGFSDLYLYCGTDMLLTFDKWHRFADILSMCTVAYAARERQDEKIRHAVEEKKSFLLERYDAKIMVILFEPIEISSSEIRQMVHRGDDASRYLPSPLWEWIKEKGLYR